MSNTNLAEYDLPELYDLENADFEPQGPFYLSLARQAGGHVLELGCGTGRLTIPIAQHGIEITGLDPAPKMIERARAKSARLPVAWIEADARDFHLDKRFGLIFASTGTFEHQLTRPDQEVFLACVHEHLRPDGLFALDVWLLKPDGMKSEVEEKEWLTYAHPNGRDVHISGTWAYDPLTQISVETARRRWTYADGQPREHVAALALRRFFPQELEVLLHYNGFDVIERFGGFDRVPLTTESGMLIFVCRRRE